MSYIKREGKLTLIVCDVCGEQRELECALRHGTHRAFGIGEKVRHYCRMCQSVEVM